MSETVFLQASPGLEGALLDEARTLRLGEARAVPGGVVVRGEAGLHRRANLESRIAGRVMLELAQVPAAKLAGLRWDAVLPRGARLDAAGDRSAPSAWPLGEGGLAVKLRREGERVAVSVDTSGELLYRRGYRQETSHAPLRETLAAGLLALAGHDPARPLWDPMCGSGTFAIEAAWRGLDRAPGLDRAFALESFPSHDTAAWDRERAQARARVRAELPAPIAASDLNAGALGVARRNARRAGVVEKLKLERLDATVPHAATSLEPGLVLANLPFGKRVGEGGDLRTLYQRFADALRAGRRGWRVAWLVEDARLLEVGIAWRERHRVDNGGLTCTFAVGEL